MSYRPVNKMYLWCLLSPSRPLLVGELGFAPPSGALHPGGVSFQYDASWLDSRFTYPLSEDLPLVSEVFFPRVKGEAPGAVDDARPDRWGERVIRRFDHPTRLSTLEYLYFAGDDRFGALGVSLSKDRYEPRTVCPLPRLEDIELVHDVAKKIEAGDPIDDRLRSLILPGAGMGGARPKALVVIDGHEWVIKFSERGDEVDVPLVEHAAMTLARVAGVDSCETRPIKIHRGHAVAVKRFDRELGGRVHAFSARSALRAAMEKEFGYPELALLLRRKGDPSAIVSSGEQVFRRMVFNILIDNTDDHEKNHALLLRKANFELAPAYDVLPTGQALGYQQIRVGSGGCESSIENALSEHHAFSLRLQDAQSIVREIASVVASWRSHFSKIGVSDKDIEKLSMQIDGPHLLAERDVALNALAANVDAPGRRRL